MAQAAAEARSQDLTIPVDVRIGILGHWDAEQEPNVVAGIATILGELNQMLDCSQPTYTLVPGLAEGAERVMSATPVGPLTARHPVARFTVGFRHYRRSFKTERSRQRFRARFKKSDSWSGQETVGERQAIGVSNVVIAVWSSGHVVDPSRAGLLIGYAIERMGRTVYWIDPASGNVICYDNDDGFIDSIRHLNLYNAGYADLGEIGFGVEEQIKALEELAVKCKIQPGSLAPLEARVVPHFVRASKLAARWQKWHVWSGRFIYGVAALAVANAAYVSVWAKEGSWVVLEVFEMALVLLMVAFSEISEWLRRWLDYRFLAERLRASIFLYLAGLRCETPNAVPQSWMVRALDSIREGPPAALDPENLEVKEFIVEGWILHQKEYYERRSKEFERWHEIFAYGGISLFVATAFAALFHFLGMFPAM